MPAGLFLEEPDKVAGGCFQGDLTATINDKVRGRRPCGNDVLERLPGCGVCGLHVSTHLAPSLSTVCIQEFFTLLGGGENLLPLRWSCSVNAI